MTEDQVNACNTCRYRFGLSMDFAVVERSTCEVCDRLVYCMPTALDDLAPERERITMAAVNRRVGKIQQLGQDGPFLGHIYPGVVDGLDQFWK